MANPHQHSCCSHEAHNQDDQHIKPGEGNQDFLFSKIALDQVTGYNVEPTRPAKSCIKAWDDRMDDAQYTESDMDQQMIIQIPFTGSVKLRTYANEPNLDFDTLEARKPTQILEIPESNEVIEFPVRVAKFSSVTSLSIFFNSTSAGADKSQIYFLGFKGEFTNVSRKPVIAIYEAKANPADHQKINGLNDSINHAI
ncbi:hypothetical protein PSHT_07889 [Puccinia striiformis]|uniref:PITH domain-containing protein n=1 Tax=Puccinia striiformis TaxID=27350 RepID=A0A2S4VTZ8_9BASI|nr:hypothetical protein H4Q26_010052 [Puccinia striiformis f. sp. tritici PST-130]KAI9623073.1 hypothetical protein KEM48_009692 [Puccinia striiformis f. sp. tritici PST-130]POW12968.1 hypothetical protein PSHT_07889 [Puccinia striiformis]